jgi:hypothetical protein
MGVLELLIVGIYLVCVLVLARAIGAGMGDDDEEPYR